MKINQQQARKIDLDPRGNPLMTLKTIKYYCHKQLLFQTPELNEKLYLHYKGFRKIQGLESYPNLVTIWLNNNCIEKIQGLQGLTNLICLYLNNNVISRIQGLQGLDKLSILHLAHNKIDKVQNLATLKSLNILNISENFLTSSQSIIGLSQSSTLTSIDLSKNQLQNTPELFEVICSLSNISCLTMKHTPIARVYKNYRKKLVYYLKKLKFLDDRPVKEVDHRLADAWMEGGPQLQNLERIKIAKQVQQKNTRQTTQLNERIRRQKIRQKQIQALQQQKRNLSLLSKCKEKQQLNQIQQTPQKQNNERQDQQHLQNEEDLKQINRRLQILRDGPKGFQAAITSTSIKILHISQDAQQQQKVINKYFYQQKLQIQQNLSKMQKQNTSNIKQAKIGQDEHIIEQRIRKILCLPTQSLESQPQSITECSLNKKWHQKYYPILQALLYKQKFNFQSTARQFNRTLQLIGKQTMRAYQKFQVQELEELWYRYELAKKQKEQLGREKDKNKFCEKDRQIEKQIKVRMNMDSQSQYQQQEIS